MDPQLTLAAFIGAFQEGDYETADEYHGYLKEWLDRGGFEPDWHGNDRETFLDYKRGDGYPDERTDEDAWLSAE